MFENVGGLSIHSKLRLERDPLGIGSLALNKEPILNAENTILISISVIAVPLTEECGYRRFSLYIQALDI